MAVSPREKIMLASTGKTKNGNPTGTFYTTQRNKRNAANKGQTGKLEISKFDPRAWNEKTGQCGMHVKFKEKKIPK